MSLGLCQQDIQIRQDNTGNLVTSLQLAVVTFRNPMAMASRPVRPWNMILQAGILAVTGVVRIFMGTTCHPPLRKCDVSNSLVAPETSGYGSTMYPQEQQNDDTMEEDFQAPPSSAASIPSSSTRTAEAPRKRTHEGHGRRNH